MGLTFDPVYRSEVFMASDGQPGVRLVPVTQDEYDRMRVQLAALVEVARAAQKVSESGCSRFPATVRGCGVCAKCRLRDALAKLDNLEGTE